MYLKNMFKEAFKVGCLKRFFKKATTEMYGAVCVLLLSRVGKKSNT